MKLHLRATKCHLPQCYLPSDRPVLDLPTPDGGGMEGWIDL